MERETGFTQLSFFLAFTAVFCIAAVDAGSEDRGPAAVLREEFRVKREANFEFARKPAVTRKGDTVIIAFETRGFCDVTVAIEDESGKILRHLACGVLGDNAPPPFTKGLKKQVLVWDGKDDQGRYVARSPVDYSDVRVRVSLGIKARFERHFLWSPHRRLNMQFGLNTWPGSAPFAAQPEGVYVFDGRMHDHLRLFDHQGNYLRTVYPFPSDKLDRLTGVKKVSFPQSGRVLPFKDGNWRHTLLTSGANYTGRWPEQEVGLAAIAMAVRKGRVALAGTQLNRLSTDGSTGGLPLTGPKIGTRFLARSAAFSPDAKTVYLAGFNGLGRNSLHWLQGVGKIDFENGKKLETFAGVLSGDVKKHGGSEPGKFRAPVSVATDPQGRVYVADHFNDRIQVFDPSGTHLKDIAVPDGDQSLPSEVVINQRNGDIYVFSWYVDGLSKPIKRAYTRRSVLFHFGPFDNPELKGKYPLPVRDQSRRSNYADTTRGREFRATIDPWASENGDPYVWIVTGHGFPFKGRSSVATASPIVLRINSNKKKLEEVKHFGKQATGDLPENEQYGTGSIWLAARPTTGELYVLRGRFCIVIDPDTGTCRRVTPPMGFQTGAMYFDSEGLAYLRSSRHVVRFAVSARDKWREVPFDYGKERAGRISVVPISTPSIHGQPGFSVSMRGDVVVGYIIGTVKAHDRGKDRDRKNALKAWEKWTPTIFPGRGGNSIVGVWDKYGKPVHQDAVRGVGFVAGVWMDRHGDIYVASEAQRHGYFDKMTGTFVKFKAEGKILSTEAAIPLKNLKPERPPDTHCGAGHKGSSWWEGAEWFYGGVGICGKNNATCNCPKFQTAHDYFDRSFLPETGHCTVAVLDSAGNLIMRIGQYGNVDDGVPLVADPRIPKPRALGGDEVALFYPAYIAVHTDRRLFIQDGGNQRIVSVKLGYHTDVRVPLRDL